MASRPLIIDCDPGVDDAIALLLALASPQELEVLGVTTVAGNVPLALTQRNARQICELAGWHRGKVFAGCPRPLLCPLETAEEVHGATGLGDRTWTDPQMPLQPQHGVDFLIETLLAASTKVTLATLGPLTNVAVAIVKEPRILPKIREMVVMGGAITGGNITPSAEFNVFVDPHAAQIVFTAGVPLTLISLDVTHQAISTPERIAAIRAIASPIGERVADLLDYYGTYERERYGWAGAPLHDPCVIAYLLRPDLFQGRDLSVTVELAGTHTLGRTVVDTLQVSGNAPNATVIETIDAGGFYQFLTERLARLGDDC